jgi:hypothetical protein
MDVHKQGEVMGKIGSESGVTDDTLQQIKDLLAKNQ